MNQAGKIRNQLRDKFMALGTFHSECWPDHLNTLTVLLFDGLLETSGLRALKGNDIAADLMLELRGRTESHESPFI